MTMDEEKHKALMRRAIALGRKSGLEDLGGGPFGALIVRHGEIVGEGVSRVLIEHDATWHSEVAAIRDACRRLKTHDLSGCVMYASGEPCEMCAGAAQRARIERIYYAGPREDTIAYGYSSPGGKPRPGVPVPKEELLRDEMREVWKEFKTQVGHLGY
jgi:tRNA(Arg) A34 adenosine deaminase TadA